MILPISSMHDIGKSFQWISPSKICYLWYGKTSVLLAKFQYTRSSYLPVSLAPRLSSLYTLTVKQGGEPGYNATQTNLCVPCN